MAILLFRIMKTCDMFDWIAYICECTMCCGFMNLLHGCNECVRDGMRWNPSVTLSVYKLEKQQRSC